MHDDDDVYICIILHKYHRFYVFYNGQDSWLRPNVQVHKYELTVMDVHHVKCSRMFDGISYGVLTDVQLGDFVMRCLSHYHTATHQSYHRKSSTSPYLFSESVNFDIYA